MRVMCQVSLCGGGAASSVTLAGGEASSVTLAGRRRVSIYGVRCHFGGGVIECHFGMGNVKCQVISLLWWQCVTLYVKCHIKCPLHM